MTFPHTLEEVCYDHPLYPQAEPREKGFLKVSDLHSLYYALYGNPEGIPVVVLHGGPGWGCEDKISCFFDLQRWNVIMFDQRGAMCSKPFGCMEENTTQHLIEDIEALREHFGVQKWVVFGGSWGSSLALLYGEAHPEHCIGFILRGIFLVRKQDALHLFDGMGKIFPDAFQPLIDHIPFEERSDLPAAYYRRFFGPDQEEQLTAARIFMRYDLSCATHLPSPNTLEKHVKNDQFVLSISKIFSHYMQHDFFIEENQILNNIAKIAHLPALIVQGRWDAICPPYEAYALYQKWPSSMLWMITQGGHSAFDPAISAALAQATDAFAEKTCNLS